MNKKRIRRVISTELTILRHELQNKATSKEHKQLAYTEISNFIKGYCYGLSDIISLNSYKLISNYMDKLYDKYLR